jgi:deoxyribodipyrimidine photo-lyase
MGDRDDPTLFWFRRDLRLSDNPALTEAAATGPVLGLFVIDPALWGPSGDPRRAFLVDCLRALDDAMGGRLVVRRGVPAEVVVEAAGEIGAGSVHATADFGPYGRCRDGEVADAVAGEGGRVRYLDSPYAVAPGIVRTTAGTPYQVFTPFYRSWGDHGWGHPIGAPDVAWLEASSGGIPHRPAVAADLPAGGEGAARARLEEFLAGPVGSYHQDRDRPGLDGTSRLSAHLKFGTIHPRQILSELGATEAEEAFRSELAWREFYADVLHARPDSAREVHDERMAGMEIDTGARAEERFEAWCRGLTGYPIVDAGMRQLLATGWMHNRLRMITASFLVKDLHLDWVRGARWFLTHLVDGDLASNNHGWQWVAGTGTDPAPYFRVFNPVTQGQRFDPDGDYITRWVPELEGRSGKALHQPWASSDGVPDGYPEPIVDHGEERGEAMARYERLRRDWA